jgi:hypothetical protein
MGDDVSAYHFRFPMIHLQALGSFIISHPLALLACIVAYMAIGAMWYGPLFKKPWARMTGMDMVPKEQMKKAMVPAMTASIITAFVQASVLGRGMEIFRMESWVHPVVIATILWFPFTFMVLAQNYAYTQKSWKLTLIDAGYMLVSGWVMALIMYVMVK